MIAEWCGGAVVGPSKIDENLTRRINRLSLFSTFLAFSEEGSVSCPRGVTEQDGFVMEAHVLHE